MDKVLIVEDNPNLLKTLKMGLNKYSKKFETIAARDGGEAITILRKINITLVVTDIQMPRIDGLALLAFMKKSHPEIPCIVMTAHATAQIREKFQQDVLKFIEKPFEIGELVQAITDALNRETSGGSLKGISIANFMQMIEMEQKTCILEVEAPKEGKGYFYFEEGVLFDAFYGDIRGVEAAVKLIPLEKAKIRFRDVPKGKKKISRRIKEELMSVIMEAMRLKDENEAEEDIDIQIIPDELPDSKEIEKEPRLKETRGEFAVSLKGFIEELKNINGYKASAIMNFTGEILESDSKDAKIDLNFLCAMFNDIFLSAHKVCEKVGFDDTLETIIVTPKGIVHMRCSGTRSKTHIHVISILEPDGNQALMKMEMERMMPALIAELA